MSTKEVDRSLRERYDLRVFIIGGGHQYIKMFLDAGLKGARSVEDADIVCFTGGEDVDPSFYGEKPLAGTHYNTRRDEIEAGFYGEALALKKPMVGICRGSQFLNVMNGGKLWQDVNNHAIGHKHPVLDMRTGGIVEGMTSTHHQMMRPADDAEILAVAGRSTFKIADSDKVARSEEEATEANDDIEVVWYTDSLCLCFQPHPEFQEGACQDYFFDLFDSHILPAC